MFIHSVRICIIQMMLLIVVLLTFVFCMPVSHDPILNTGFEPGDNGNLYHRRSNGYLKAPFALQRSKEHGLNKWSVVRKMESDAKSYKHRTNRNKRSFYETKTRLTGKLTNDRNIQTVQPETVYGYGFNIFNMFNQSILKTIFSKEMGKPSKLRQFRRDAISEIDLDLDRGIYKEFSTDDLNLQALYEKRGGACMLIQGYKKSPVYVINTCPFLYPHTSERNLCEYVSPGSRNRHHENIIELTNTPVQGRHGFVYRNIYCAKCHNAYGIQAWSTSLLCDDMQQLKLSDGQHDVTFMSEFVDKTQSCRRVLTPVTTHGLHECEMSEITDVLRHWHETRMGDNSKNEHSPFPLSFTLFMNFGFDGKTHILFSTSPTDQLGYICNNNNEMYDPVNNKCRVMSCRDGYQLVEGSCQKTATYEYDPTQDFDFSQTEEPLQVVLTLRNISYDMLYILSLPGMETMVADAIATEVNISMDRIQDLNVTILNSTDAANGTLKDQIEIHRVSSPELAKMFHTSTAHKLISNETSHNASKWMHSINETDKGNPENGADDDNRSPEESTINENHNVNTATNNVSSKNDTKYIEHGHKGLVIPKTVSPQTGQIKHSMLPPYKDNTFWLLDSKNNYSVRIAFILQEAQKNTTITERSVQGVVAKMNDLIRNNSFMFTLNGTDFQIEKLENAPPPTSLDNFCKLGRKTVYDQNEFTFISYVDEAHNTTKTIIYINQTDKIYHVGEYDLTVSIDGLMTNLSTTEMDSFVIVCDSPKIHNEFCPQIYLEKDEYQILDNYSIYFADKAYNYSEYEYNSTEDESVRICAPDWSDAQRLYSEEKWAMACGDNMITLVVVEGYLTFILGLISIVSMLTVLISYSLFERLRNLPGVNTMNLTLALFLGELVFMLSGWIQPRVAWLCSGVGILLHYLFLASFFWMNIMSFDVYRTFAKKCILRRIRDKKKNVPRYALYAWGSPLLIVAVCVFLDFSNAFDGVDIGYGGSSFESNSGHPTTKSTASEDDDSSEDIVYNIGCWIQKPVASMLAFGGPMMLILFSNFVMFTRTIICIRASTKSTRISVRRESLNHMAGRDDVMLYIRMSTVMGFTWIFGLASSVVSAFAGSPSKITCILLHLLGILFIILNCSQGIFIFFAFVCNRRVLGLYKRLFRKLKESRKRPLSVSTSRGTIYSVNTTSQTTVSTCA